MKGLQEQRAFILFLAGLAIVGFGLNGVVYGLTMNHTTFLVLGAIGCVLGIIALQISAIWQIEDMKKRR